jgi:hypothetical protein
VIVQVNASGRQHPVQPGHGHDVGANHAQEFRIRSEPHFTHVQHMAAGRAELRGVGGEAAQGLIQRLQDSGPGPEVVTGLRPNPVVRGAARQARVNHDLLEAS